jgi:hypothetical protein
MKQTQTGQHHNLVILPPCPDSTPPAPTLRIGFKLGGAQQTLSILLPPISSQPVSPARVIPFRKKARKLDRSA